jgi:hypothetical protein
MGVLFGQALGGMIIASTECMVRSEFEPRCTAGVK